MYRTGCSTNRMNEQTEGIFSVRVEREGDGWVSVLEEDGGEKRLHSSDGKTWR